MAEGLEQPRLIALRNADAGIMNLYFDLYSRIAHRPLFNQHINVAVLGEFNRVTHQIGDYLLQAQRIANHIIRDIAFNVEGELKAFIVR